MLEKKPDDENDELLIKVIDFGTSTLIDPSEKLTQRKGTSMYMAPEVIQKQEYDFKCDIWSVGVILYILLSGTPPWAGKKEETIMKNVLTGKVEMEGREWRNVSQFAKDLVLRMLTFDPEKRPSADE